MRVKSALTTASSLRWFYHASELNLLSIELDGAPLDASGVDRVVDMVLRTFRLVLGALRGLD